MILTSTREPRTRARFGEAMTQNLAPGGGLFVPLALPVFDDVDGLLELPWIERSTEILRRFLGDEYSEDEITFTAQIYEPPLQYHYL